MLKIIFFLNYFFKGLATISTEITGLAAKARQGKLQPHEFQVFKNNLFKNNLRVELLRSQIWECLEAWINLRQLLILHNPVFWQLERRKRRSYHRMRIMKGNFYKKIFLLSSLGDF